MSIWILPKCPNSFYAPNFKKFGENNVLGLLVHPFICPFICHTFLVSKIWGTTPENMRKCAIWHECPMKTQISLCSHTVWSQSLLSIWKKLHSWLSKMCLVKILIKLCQASLGGSVGCDWRPGGHRFNPCRGRQHSSMEIDHEIFSTVILSLPLIQEGQLSLSGQRMCTILVNHLED